MVAIKHKKVTGRPVALSDWEDNHVLTGTPGMTIVFDETGQAVEVLPGEGTGGTPVDLSNYYTKEQVDAAIAAAIGGTPPAVTLAALSLSSSAFTVGTATSGTISGATNGSTITLSSGPTGFTINSEARTWAYSGAGAASSGNLTLTEALAGATNTPRASSIGFTVASAPVTGLDPNISVPILSLVSSNPDGSSPVIDIELNDTHQVGDTIRLYRRNKAGALIQTYTNAVDASEATSKTANFGLSAVPAGTWRYSSDVLRGASHSDLSAVLVVGPDDQEPTLTLPTKTAIGATGATLGFTTDEAGPRYTVIVPAAEATPTNTQVKAGQRANGTAAPFVITGTATVGVNTFSATGLTAETAYKVCSVVEDTSTPPNLSAVLTDTLTTAAGGTSVAKLVIGQGTDGATNNEGVNKSRFINVAADGLTFTGNADQGAMNAVRSTAAMPAKAHSEITSVNITGGVIYFGVVNSSVALGPSVFPNIGGSGGQDGWRATVTSGGLTIHCNGDELAFNMGGANDNTVSWGFGYDNSNSAAPKFYIIRETSGGTETLFGPYTLSSLIPANPTVFVGASNSGNGGVINFGASAFTKTPVSGHTGF